jgi:hypothetical protein
VLACLMIATHIVFWRASKGYQYITEDEEEVEEDEADGAGNDEDLNEETRDYAMDPDSNRDVADADTDALYRIDNCASDGAVGCVRESRQETAGVIARHPRRLHVGQREDSDSLQNTEDIEVEVELPPEESALAPPPSVMLSYRFSALRSQELERGVGHGAPPNSHEP